MSFPSPKFGDTQALRHRKMALWKRLRQNPLLKIFALAASIMLYIFVQQERNPTTSRQLLATVVYANLPQNVEIGSDTTQVDVQVSGPRSVVEQLKDGDIKAMADFGDVQVGEAKPVKIRLQFKKPDSAPEITIDPTLRTIKAQLYAQKTRQVEVKANYNKEAPPGLRYGLPDIHPRLVKVIGRDDRVNRVELVVVNATPTEPTASIDGDFAVSARDSDNNPIVGVEVKPDTVHVTIPLVTEPYAKIVTVSASITDLPLPPFTIGNVDVMPRQVRIIGRPERVNQITTVTTEEISVHDLMETKTLEVNLVPLPDVVIRDLQGHPLNHVTVQITLRKTPVGPSPSPAPGQPP